MSSFMENLETLEILRRQAMAGVFKKCPHCGATAYDGDPLACGYCPPGCDRAGGPGRKCRGIQHGDGEGKRPGALFQAAPRPPAQTAVHSPVQSPPEVLGDGKEDIPFGVKVVIGGISAIVVSLLMPLICVWLKAQGVGAEVINNNGHDGLTAIGLTCLLFGVALFLGGVGSCLAAANTDAWWRKQ